MLSLPQGVTVLHEDLYNVQGTACCYCHYSDPEQAAEVLRNAFPEGPAKGFEPVHNPESGRALVGWAFKDEHFVGDVLVDAELKPVGFCIGVYTGEMVFTLEGDHIPYPRFPDDVEAGNEANA